MQNVTVETVKFTRTDNGLRIKTWAKPSSSFVSNILFRNVTMNNVKNPIIIDQNYCPHKKNCPDQVRTSQVDYSGRKFIPYKAMSHVENLTLYHFCSCNRFQESK